MIENAICPIWGTPAQVTLNGTRDGESYDSPRAGGKFFISYTALEILKNRDERLKAKLTSWLVEQRRLGDQKPEILSTTIDEANESRFLSVFERANRTLRHIQSQTSYIGNVVELFRDEGPLNVYSTAKRRGKAIDETNKSRCFVSLYFKAFSESVNLDEVAFLLRYLNSHKWIDHKDHSGIQQCELTVEGYTRLAELEKRNVQSSTAFVAMWFDSSMENLWKDGIKPGIEDAGYDAIRIDQTEPKDKIDDAIIAGIRRSRFVLADFTHGEKGARGNVYYEAGYAHGMNIDVIFSCRKDMIKILPFDTRQYKHIEWEKDKLGEFREMLTNRIAAVIGDGPNKDDT